MEGVVEEKDQDGVVDMGEWLEGDGEPRGAPEEEQSSTEVEQEEHVFKHLLPLEGSHGIGFLVLDVLVLLQGSH